MKHRICNSTHHASVLLLVAHGDPKLPGKVNETVIKKIMENLEYKCIYHNNKSHHMLTSVLLQLEYGCFELGRVLSLYCVVNTTLYR